MHWGVLADRKQVPVIFDHKSKHFEARRMPASTNGYLPVNRDEHQVYWEADKEEGEGKIPVLVLHGGWGPLGHDGRFLDRSRFRRVYMHQRGWGKSTPIGMKQSQRRLGS